MVRSVTNIKKGHASSPYKEISQRGFLGNALLIAHAPSELEFSYTQRIQTLDGSYSEDFDFYYRNSKSAEDQIQYIYFTPDLNSAFGRLGSR